jgi:hypothetical protein
MRLITRLKVFVEELGAAFPAYEFELYDRGKGTSSRWRTIYIFSEEDGEKISRGRVTLQEIEHEVWSVYYVKRYKPWDYEYDPSDAFFYAFDTWFDTRKVIDVNALVPLAKENRIKKMAEVQAWRDEHPTEKKRAAISESWTGELSRLVQVEDARLRGLLVVEKKD